MRHRAGDYWLAPDALHKKWPVEMPRTLVAVHKKWFGQLGLELGVLTRAAYALGGLSE